MYQLVLILCLPRLLGNVALDVIIRVCRHWNSSHYWTQLKFVAFLQLSLPIFSSFSPCLLSFVFIVHFHDFLFTPHTTRVLLACNYWSLQNKEARMAKQHAEAKAWEVEFSRRQHVLKPVKIGISWSCNLSDEQSTLLGQFAARAFLPLPIPVCLGSPISKLSCGECWLSCPVFCQCLWLPHLLTPTSQCIQQLSTCSRRRWVRILHRWEMLL